MYVFSLMLPSPPGVQIWKGADEEPRAKRRLVECLFALVVVPQMSHGFGADQRQDDVVVLLTLEPVHRCHLHKKEMMSKHTIQYN